MGQLLSRRTSISALFKSLPCAMGLGYCTDAPISVSVEGERRLLQSAAGRWAAEQLLHDFTNVCEACEKKERPHLTENVCGTDRKYETLTPPHHPIHTIPPPTATELQPP